MLTWICMLILGAGILGICSIVHISNPQLYKTWVGYILFLGIVIGLILVIWSEFTILSNFVNL